MKNVYYLLNSLVTIRGHFTCFVFQSVHAFVSDCLIQARRCGVRTLAFPAVGAGGLGYPPDIVADQMFETVINSDDTAPLTAISFVVYHADTLVLKVYIDLSSCYQKINIIYP